MERAKARRAIGVIASVLVLGGIGWAAGTGTISGTVRDKDTGEPLPGASVIVEGTKLGAIADREGTSPSVYTPLPSGWWDIPSLPRPAWR